MWISDKNHGNNIDIYMNIHYSGISILSRDRFEKAGDILEPLPASPDKECDSGYE